MIKFSEADLLKCCGSQRWAGEMAEHSFPNAKEVLATADSIWWSLDPEDWEEAFNTFIPLGERTDLLEVKPEVMEQIRAAEKAYQERYGRRFVTTAVGRTAQQLLKTLQERTEMDAMNPLRANAEQQLQVTHKRLKRLLSR